MFSDLTKEYPSTWNQRDVIEWKEKAMSTLKNYYLGFAGRQWDEYEIPRDRESLRAKICYAIYGSPMSEADSIEQAYEDAQRKQAEEILNPILKVYQASSAAAFRVGFVFVACKQEDNEFVIPVFRVFTGLDNSKQETSQYVDYQCRIYKTWADWTQNNLLPMLKYAYPSNGFFTCHEDDEYEFDAERNPKVTYGTSPQCDLRSRLFRQSDSVANIASLGAGAITLASLCVAFPPALFVGAGIAGVSSAVYGAGRAINRLADKGQHGQSLTDLESVTLWFSIAATPLHFASSLANARLIRGAVIEGRIFTSSQRLFATLLNFTTVGVDGMMFTFGLVNLIEKSNKRTLSTLDVLQFSMSVFFFSNTLIQPKVASRIIENAQNQHIQQYFNAMTDEGAQKNFQKFLDQNKMDGTITDKSKIVRTINRMEDPAGFFKSLGPETSVEIGGRKGKTVIVTDAHNNKNRVNPNRVLFSQNTQNPVHLEPRIIKKLESFGNDPTDSELKNIFANLDDRQTGRIMRVVGPSKCDKDVVKTAFAVAKVIGLTTPDDVMSMIEIVLAEGRGKAGNALKSFLQDIRGTGKQEFVDRIETDLRLATEIANKSNLNFANPLMAVYHYRKHGAEFSSCNEISFYLGKLPKKLIQDGNLTEIQTIKSSDGAIRKFYITQEDSFAVVTETPGRRTISTMFQKPKCMDNFMVRLQESQQNRATLETPNVLAERLAEGLGFRAFHVYTSIDDEKTELKNTNMDLEVQEEIFRILSALASDQ